MSIIAGPGGSTDIVTVEQVRKQLNIAADDTSQDEELAVYVAAVTEVVESFVGPVVPRAVTETHFCQSAGPLVLRKPPALSVVSVAQSGVTLPADGYRVDAGMVYRRHGHWQRAGDGITVVYQAGRSPVPASITLAAKELAMVNFRPQLGGDYSPFDTDAPGEGVPGEVRLGFFVPNRVRELLAPHDQYAGIG